MRPKIPCLIASLLCSPGAFPREHHDVGFPVSGAPHQETLATLAAAGTTPPRGSIGPPAIEQERAVFDRLIGAWDVSYEIYDKDGKVRLYRGGVTYAWILDGGALQEIWTSDAHDKEPQPYGTTISFYDSKRQRWTAIWIYPAQAMSLIVSGNAVDGGIELTGHDAAGAIQRWLFNDFQADSFTARYDISNDEGKTWRLLGVNHMRRHRAATSWIPGQTVGP
jgi:hypothetical protein